MTSTTFVPPQAYTRDVLVKAFEWFNSQPPSVRERATSTDALVGLYLQAKRRGFTPTLGTAPSVQAFKEDLRNLAEGLKQFDEPLAPPHTSSPAAAWTPAAARPDDFVPEPPTASQSTQALPDDPCRFLDPRSRGLVRDVQTRLNLSTEADALRALISVGYERFRELLPRP